METKVFKLTTTGPRLLEITKWLMSNGIGWKIDFLYRRNGDPTMVLDIVWELYHFAVNHSGNQEVSYLVMIDVPDLAMLFKLTWIGDEH